jgi:protein-S-isoprenylcysteine O-methyltransferase Ste14
MAGTGYEPSVMRAIAEASILISLAFLVTILGGYALTVWLRLPPLLPSPWNLVGLPLGIAGGASLVYCGAFLSRHGRGTPYPRLPPKRLVTTGPFAHVRNPIIVSWGVLLVGIGLTLTLAGIFLLLVPAFFGIHAYLVYREEPVLRTRFPAEYGAYKSRVPRWIPRIRT